MAYAISKTCTKCGACLPECPSGSIIEGKTQFYIDADTCADHTACVNVCPVNAIAAIKGSEADSLKKEKAEEEEE